MLEYDNIIYGIIITLSNYTIIILYFKNTIRLINCGGEMMGEEKIIHVLGEVVRPSSYIRGGQGTDGSECCFPPN